MTPQERKVIEQALKALELAQDNLRPHGDNCFLHDDGEYNRCFCGKDSLSDHLQSVIENLDTALRQAIERQPADEPVAWKLNVDINNYQGQSEYRTVLAFRPDPVVTGNYEVNEVISAQPLYTRPQEFVCSTGLCRYKAKSDERLMKMPDEPFCWCIETVDSADWCFAKTKEGAQSNSVLMDDDCVKTEPFPLYTRPQPAAPKENP